MNEKTWEGAFGRISTHSPIPRYHNVTVPYDPNNDTDEASIKYWLQYSDFYLWPHIQTFDSWDDLFSKCAHTEDARGPTEWGSSMTALQPGLAFREAQLVRALLAPA
jgi:hypothetical protein